MPTFQHESILALALKANLVLRATGWLAAVVVGDSSGVADTFPIHTFGVRLALLVLAWVNFDAIWWVFPSWRTFALASGLRTFALVSTLHIFALGLWRTHSLGIWSFISLVSHTFASGLQAAAVRSALYIFALGLW